MKQYVMKVAYDGTDYVGWIQQPNRPSIVRELQRSFYCVFHKKIALLGASKTDAGVHAYGQIAIFKTDLAVDLDRMKWAWNNALPSAITIHSLWQDATFHPHYRIEKKIYQYHFFVERPLPFWARYGSFVRYPLDLKKFEQALSLFVGTHNFVAFYTGHDRDNDAIRTIDSIHFEYIARYNVYRVQVEGKRFLRHMIRRIIGAAFTVASDRQVTINDLEITLKTGAMHAELITAPAQGLLLRRIIYGERI